MEKKIRQQLRFYGRVQGVGFRYTAQHAAYSLGLTGWVLNDYDGSVLMEVQGTKEKILKMIEMLENGVFIEIDSIDKTELPVLEYESSFHIKD
ncbi:MAG: acylphosphatase [Treponema sp.]|nr:acylphosphatase [Treponema sp.]